MSIRPVFMIIVIISTSTGIAFGHDWMAPKEAGENQNPVLYESSSVKRGEVVYLENCTACHGDNATGLQAKETGLSKDAPNLRRRLATHSDGDFFWKIQEGRGEMPPFKDELDRSEIWDTINFLKTKE